MDKHTETPEMGRKPKRKSVKAMDLPVVRPDAKILKRSYQRSGIVGRGTLLSSGTRQATVTFRPKTFHLLELAAAKNEISLSEMIRQCVERVVVKDEE
jgi:hypothetical protein